MSALSRVLVMFLLNFFVAKGLLPQTVVDELSRDPEVMLALELGLTTALTLITAGFWELLKAWPRMIRKALGVEERKDNHDGAN